MRPSKILIVLVIIQWVSYVPHRSVSILGGLVLAVVLSILMPVLSVVAHAILMQKPVADELDELWDVLFEK